MEKNNDNKDKSDNKSKISNNINLPNTHLYQYIIEIT